MTLGVAEAIAAKGNRPSVLCAIDIDRSALDVYKRNIGPAITACDSVNSFVRFGLGRGAEGAIFADGPAVLPPLLDCVGSVDLIIGGPPCQGHSGFNNKTRRDDPRNSLYVSAVATCIALNATALILENVPEVRRSRFDVVGISKDLLAASGYVVDDGIISATDIGWPQMRRRHFLVASRRKLKPLNEAVETCHGLAPGAADFLALLPRRAPHMEALPEYSPATKDRLRFYRDNPEAFDLPLRERPECHREGTTYGSVYGRMRPDEPIPTLTSGFLTLGRGRFVHPNELRTLTCGEAAYAQGFPAWFDFGGTEVSRQALTKWIGDAVPLPMGFVAAQCVLPGVLGDL